MIDFKTRSTKTELLDNDIIPTQDLFLNLAELDFINQKLGGYSVVLSGIQKILDASAPQKTVKILDIGSGGGDTLKQIYHHFIHHHPIELTGVDLKKDCIDYSIKNTDGLPIQFIKSDYRDLLQSKQIESFDIITASLFCHHLQNESLTELFQWMSEKSNLGFVINDLHRHFLAFYSIKWLTYFFSKSYLIKNDAPLSVLRSFTRYEFKSLLEKANIKNYHIQWKWAFRWLMVATHEKI